MPFRSEKQRKYLWKFHPDIAKRWAHKYGSKPQKKARYKGQRRNNTKGKK